MKTLIITTTTTLLLASLSANAAGIGRAAAVRKAMEYISSGTVKDRNGRTIDVSNVNSFVNLGNVETLGSIYSVGLEAGTDWTALGGYREVCTGSVQINAADGAVLSSEFTCADRE